MHLFKHLLIYSCFYLYICLFLYLFMHLFIYTKVILSPPFSGLHIPRFSRRRLRLPLNNWGKQCPIVPSPPLQPLNRSFLNVVFPPARRAGRRRLVGKIRFNVFHVTLQFPLRRRCSCCVALRSDRDGCESEVWLRDELHLPDFDRWRFLRWSSSPESETHEEEI